MHFRFIADTEDTSKRVEALKHRIDRKLLGAWVKSKDKLLIYESRYSTDLLHSNTSNFILCMFWLLSSIL